jgi:hypothetical protein
MKERMSIEGFFGAAIGRVARLRMDPSRGSLMHRSRKSQLLIELADGVTLDEVKSKTEANSGSC